MDQREVWNSFYADNNRPWRGISDICVPFPVGSKILEVGCGNGKTAIALAEAGMDVTAVDYSDVAIGICSAYGRNIDFRCADVTRLPFGDDSFDGSLAFHVFEHLSEQDMKAAASELLRVLKPSAKLLVKVFSTDDMRSGNGRRIDGCTVERGNGIIYRYFTEETLRDAMGCFECSRMETVKETTRFGTVRSRIEAEFVCEIR